VIAAVTILSGHNFVFITIIAVKPQAVVGMNSGRNMNAELWFMIRPEFMRGEFCRNVRSP
jgi:hypothetical protein